MLQTMGGKTFPENQRANFLDGGTEMELVRTGLENILLNAWDWVSTSLDEHGGIHDYRPTAYIISIGQVASGH